MYRRKPCIIGSASVSLQLSDPDEAPAHQPSERIASPHRSGFPGTGEQGNTRPLITGTLTKRQVGNHTILHGAVTAIAVGGGLRQKQPCGTGMEIMQLSPCFSCATQQQSVTNHHACPAMPFRSVSLNRRDWLAVAGMLLATTVSRLLRHPASQERNGCHDA